MQTTYRSTRLIGCVITGQLVREEKTEEGEVVPYNMASMEFGSNIDGSGPCLSPYWPLVVAHKIDSSSPLYSLTPRDLATSQVEIIITLEGTTPDTSSTVQVRTSYLPSEILWGQRFDHTTVTYDTDSAKYSVSFKTINSSSPDRTPRSVLGQSLHSGLIIYLLSRLSAEEIDLKKQEE